MKKLSQIQHANFLQKIEIQESENKRLQQEREDYQKQNNVSLLELEKLKVMQEQHQQKIQEHEKVLEEKEQELKEADKLLEHQKEKLAKGNQTIETMKVQQEEQQKRFDEKESFLKQQEKQMQERFENLANQILENKGKQFSEQQNKKLSELLQPFQKDLATFKQEAETARKHEIEKRGQIDEKLSQLMQLNQQLSQDANNLTNALKSDSQIQGTWGETILEKVLESVGFQKGREYEMQVSLQDEEQQRKRPDALVYLPENKLIIIDAKTSLKAYSNFCDATDEDSRKHYLNEHIRSIQNHIKELSKKDYANLPDLKGQTLDMVLMFIPIEGAFSIALQNQSSLCDDAFKKRVFIVSQTTLFVSLYAIKALWNTEDQAQNVREIADRASKMLDKFTTFVEDLEKVGKQLGQTQKSYDDAWNKLKTGKGNLIKQATQIQELGISHKKQLPTQLLDQTKRKDDLERL